MTIVAGFPGQDFRYVVLAADSDESGTVTKSSVRKIATLDRGDCKVLIGGAGNGDFIDFAVQKIGAELAPPYSVQSINELIEEIVTDIYAERIDSYPAHEQDDLVFELLCAVWVKDDSIAPQLIRARRALHLIRTAPEAIGAGSDLARYLIATLAIKNMTIAQAYRLAVYLIAQVKKHAVQCGGTTQVIGIDQNGVIVELIPQTVTQHESTAGVILERAMPFLFYASDPIAAQIMRVNVDGAIDFAAAQIKKELASVIPQLSQPTQPPPAGTGPTTPTAVPQTQEGDAQSTPESSTGAASDPPPSQE